MSTLTRILATLAVLAQIAGAQYTAATHFKHAEPTVQLPFSFTARERTDSLPEYVTPPAPNLYNNTPSFHVGWGIDYPISSVVIGGQVWVIFNLGNQYGTHVKVARYKGADFEHTTRQADGAIDIKEKNISTHFCGGMWFDTTSARLYAPIHCEYDRTIQPPAGWSRKKTRLAVSADTGKTWTLVGDILTSALGADGDWLKFSGSYFEAGPADFDFYVDNRSGYFYIFTCNAYAPKNGPMNNFLWFNEAARCAIADKMAPGRWHKFHNGRWDEPGLGGRSSHIMMGSDGIYGRVIYSTLLHQYLRIGRRLGAIDKRFTDLGYGDASVYIASCPDLSAQQWTPMTKLLNKPDNDKFGYTLTDGASVDPWTCRGSLKVYNYWLYNLPSSEIDVALAHGMTPASVFPLYGSYAYEPLSESGDTIVSRRTRIVDCTSSEVRYDGGVWSEKVHPRSYQGHVMECAMPTASISFTFTGSGIYWRAVADTDCGKADISIDGKFQTTVDCYYKQPLPYPFAFIKTGLAPHIKHTITVTIRPDTNARSIATFIRHMAFEYTAESDRASAGFSSVMGKNNWSYMMSDGKTTTRLAFHDYIMLTINGASGGGQQQKRVFANFWGDEGRAVVGNNYQIPGAQRVVRAWTAPHGGHIRIEGVMHTEADTGAVNVVMMKNRTTVMAQRTVTAQTPCAHDLHLDVKRGDTVSFIAEKPDSSLPIKLFWDPVVTYEDR